MAKTYTVGKNAYYDASTLEMLNRTLAFASLSPKSWLASNLPTLAMYCSEDAIYVPLLPESNGYIFKFKIAPALTSQSD